MARAADAATLFEEFLVSFARGQDPDVADFLARAGDERVQLEQMIDRYLSTAVPPEPDEEKVELMRAWVAGQPPLLELRTRRRMKRDAVSSWLVSALGLDAKKERKVARYYHQLESGQLELAGVDQRVWEALSRLFEANVRQVAAWGQAPLKPRLSVAFRHADELAAFSLAIPDPRPPEPAPSEPAAAEADEGDEVDRLFRRATR